MYIRNSQIQNVEQKTSYILQLSEILITSRAKTHANDVVKWNDSNLRLRYAVNLCDATFLSASIKLLTRTHS